MAGDDAAWAVRFTRCAEEDLRGIFAFLAGNDGPDIAEAILEKFVRAESRGSPHGRSGA